MVSGVQCCNEQRESPLNHSQTLWVLPNGWTFCLNIAGHKRNTADLLPKGNFGKVRGHVTGRKYHIFFPPPQGLPEPAWTQFTQYLYPGDEGKGLYLCCNNDVMYIDFYRHLSIKSERQHILPFIQVLKHYFFPFKLWIFSLEFC